MKILVMGGCGFIGSHVSEQLVAAGHQVAVFARRNADRVNLRQIEERVEFVYGDFLNSRDVRRAVADHDVVVHLIGSTIPSLSLDSPVFDLETNVSASINLFTACVECQVRKIVYISSGGTVYGVPRTSSIAENHPLDPITPYGLSKMTTEKFLGMFAYQHGVDFTVLRLSNPYGQRQRPGSGQGVIAAWIHNAMLGNAIELWGDGTVVRDYLLVNDAAAAIVLAAESSECPAVMNVGSGVGYSLAEVLDIVKAVSGRRLKIVHRQGRKADVPRNVLDVTLIREKLGWVPTTDLLDGVRAMWETAPSGLAKP